MAKLSIMARSQPVFQIVWIIGVFVSPKKTKHWELPFVLVDTNWGLHQCPELLQWQTTSRSKERSAGSSTGTLEATINNHDQLRKESNTPSESNGLLINMTVIIIKMIVLFFLFNGIKSTIPSIVWINYSPLKYIFHFSIYWNLSAFFGWNMVELIHSVKTTHDNTLNTVLWRKSLIHPDSLTPHSLHQSQPLLSPSHFPPLPTNHAHQSFPTTHPLCPSSNRMPFELATFDLHLTRFGD